MEPRLSDRASVTCGVKGMKLFGVRILEVAIPSAAEQEEVMRKSASMGNLASCFASGSVEAATVAGDHGYLSDGGLLGGSRRRRGGGQERKRGVPWTEEEHRTFLTGLKKLGKGDWRGISRDFVPTRTPTQVASHAQKYFLRRINPNKKKRRSSLFDVMIDETATIVKTDPKLSLKETHEATKEIDHLCHDNHLTASPSFNTIHAVSRGIETSQPLSLSTDCNKTRNSASVNFMVETSASTNPTPTFHSNSAIFVPDLLKLSLSHPHRPIQSSAASPLIETSNLELSIAPPPHPRSLSKLPSQGVEGGIRVV